MQAPSFTQNYNRYSYVVNNPLTLTDPTGYKYTWLDDGGGVGQIVTAVISIGTCGLNPYCVAGATTVTAKVQGASWNEAFRAGAIAGVSAWAFGQIGDHFAAEAALNNELADTLSNSMGITSKGMVRDLSDLQTVQRIAAHAMTGGVMAALSGDKFGHGFVSAGLAVGFAGPISGIDGFTGAKYARIAMAAVVGGTASQLTGGKFANGAVYGAFSRAFNDEQHQETQYNYHVEWKELISGGITTISGFGGAVGGAGVFIVGCMAAEPCGLVVGISSVGATALGAITMRDGVMQMDSAVSRQVHIDTIPLIGNLVGGERGQMVGEKLNTAISIMNISKGGPALMTNPKLTEILGMGNDVYTLTKGSD